MFTLDSRTEKFLDSIGVKWRYSNDMAFEQMAEKWDVKNLGRSQVRVDGAVAEYGALMDRGSAAPAPILWCDPDTKLHEVLDGMQRMLAEEIRNPASFSSYVVETDSRSMVKKIRVFANYRLQGGYQESSEWTLERAVVLLINDGTMSVEDVAEMGGWSPAAVRDKKQVVDFRIAVCGVGGPDNLPDSTLRIVAKNASREDFEAAPVALAGFTNDLKAMRLSATEAEPYIEQFFSVSRPKGKLFDQFTAKLKEFRGDDDVASRLADPHRRRYQSMTPEGRLMKALKGACTAAIRIRDEGSAIEDMAEFYQVTNKTRTTLQQIERTSKRRGRHGK